MPARRYGVPVTIVVPHGNSAEKNAAMRAQGARLIEHGADFDEARVEAARLAAAEGLEFAPSFAPDLVLGVATYALELFRGAPPLDALYVPIGLGCGICGCILARDLLGLPDRDHRRAERRGARLRALLRRRARGAKRRAPTPSPTAWRRACPIPAALDIIRRGAARIVTVSDDEVAAAIRAYWQDTHNLAEGAGAAPLAALLQEAPRMRGRRVGLVLCGGNIDLALFRRWVLGVAG